MTGAIVSGIAAVALFLTSAVVGVVPTTGAVEDEVRVAVQVANVSGGGGALALD